MGKYMISLWEDKNILITAFSSDFENITNNLQNLQDIATFMDNDKSYMINITKIERKEM